MADFDIATAARNLFVGIDNQRRLTHAAIAITTAAILDSKLEHCLKRAMRPMPKKVYDKLFNQMRPLSSFDSKIVMAFALSIITKDVYHELDKIRQIRNTFAHSTETLHFGSKPIAPMFESLKRPQDSKATMRRESAFVECAKAIDIVLDEYLIRMGEPSI